MLNKLLRKRLYTSIFVMMLSLPVANSQIIYSDINPDFTMPTWEGNYILDFNDDGIQDFNFRKYTFVVANCVSMSRPRTSFLSISALNEDFEVGITNGKPTASNANTVISETMMWSKPNSANLLYCYKPCGSTIVTYTGNWDSTEVQYLPVRFGSTGNWRYGWISMIIHHDGFTGADTSLQMNAFAYNSSPNQAILAGDTGLPLHTFEANTPFLVDLLPNPTTNQLTITFERSYKKAVITIADILGKIVYFKEENETEKIEVDTYKFEEGIYLVQVRSDDLIATKKLVVKK